MPWIKHRGGPIEADFRVGWEGRLLAELADEDPKEDMSVAVLHESGWYLSVLPDGNALLDNSEEEETEPQSAMLDEDDIVEAFRAVASGDIEAVSTIIRRAQASD
jgi:hypothetical protein